MRDALEEAILDNPDDVAAHAAYADWLTEQPAPQDVALGEFIQTQLALEAGGGPAAETAALRRKAAALLKAHRHEWEGEWVELAGARAGRCELEFPDPRPVRFVRGLPAEAVAGQLDVDCARALNHSPPARFIRKLYVGGFAYQEDGEYEPDEDTAAAPRDYYPAEGVFARWPHFGHLRVFQLGWITDEGYKDRCWFRCFLDGQGVVDLVRRMHRLEKLLLFAHDVPGGQLFALPMPKLRVLQLYHSREHPLEKLARNASLGRLTHLLIHPHVEEEPSLDLKGLRALARSPHLRSLSHLRLRLTSFGDAGVKEIVTSGLLGRLQELDLRHGAVTDEGARLLAAAPEVRRLSLLDLSRNALTEAGVAELRATGVPLVADYQHASDDERYLDDGDYE
jgi:uncharacterized protein (TIGR02996 family)